MDALRFYWKTNLHFTSRIITDFFNNIIFATNYTMGYGVKRHFQQYSNYIVAVSFIGGGNLRTREKNTDLSQVTDKRYQITSTPLNERGSNSQHQW